MESVFAAALLGLAALGASAAPGDPVRGVELRLCEYTLKSRNIDPKQALEEAVT